MIEEKYVWHFSDGNLAYGDKREIVSGLSLACEPEKISLCNYGFHGSYDIFDALDYAPGAILSYCAIGGRIIEGDDKIVASQRRHLIVVDIERTLHEFAIWCAEQALSLIDSPDKRSLKVLEIKRLWLDGKATDEELAAASAAAWDAAWDAASAAARDAASAASAAARDAASAAASAAARAAAWAAARAAAWAAARDAQKAKLLAMVLSLPELEDVE